MTVKLTLDERNLINKHLSFYQNLDQGALEPTTPEQTHFVMAVRGSASATTAHEVAYLKWKLRETLPAKSIANIVKAMDDAESKWSAIDTPASPYATQPAGPPAMHMKTCPSCAGDGGYNNGCFRCGGSGWID